MRKGREKGMKSARGTGQHIAKGRADTHPKGKGAKRECRRRRDKDASGRTAAHIKGRKEASPRHLRVARVHHPLGAPHSPRRGARHRKGGKRAT